MAEAVVSSVGQTVGNLLTNEAKFLWGVEGKVEDLYRELRLIRCLLRDADARRQHNEAVGECVTQLREFAYDAEDIIERYTLRVALKKEQYITRSYACFVAKCTCVQVHMVGTEIEDLKSRISNLRTSMLAFGAQPAIEGDRNWGRDLTLKRTYTHFEKEFVGREDSVKELVEKLKDKTQHRVISIWGMGGVGKTSLARKVYTHDEVRKNFTGFAWACVSQEYDVQDILVGILIKLIPDQNKSVKKMKNQELSEKLQETLKEKSCFVVLDDIWTKEAWNSLQVAFRVENTESKLLITTRNRDVATYINPQEIHELQCLLEEESWDLLMKRAFPERKGAVVENSSDGPGVSQDTIVGEAREGIGKQSETEGQIPGTSLLNLSFWKLKQFMKGLVVKISSNGPGVSQDTIVGQAMEGIGKQSETEGQIPVITEDKKNLARELLKKCAGLPLAIIVLGGLLAVNEWQTIHEKINLHFSDESDVSKVLALSYDDLPWHLKPCFLYLSIFPVDAEIPATKILYMWIAEGFVLLNAYNKKREISVEEEAEQYLTELVNRGMVQVQFKSSGKIKSCHLHDLMRELCVSKAPQESFLSIPNIQQDNETENCSASMAIKVESRCKIRRLSLNRNVISSLKASRRTLVHLRTLMSFRDVEWQSKKQIQFILKNYKFLRVLKLENLDVMRGSKKLENPDMMKSLPKSVGDLVHLRFLSLKGKMLDLPQSMGNLVYMEFLDLHLEVATLPNVLWKMRSLRYLHLPCLFTVKEKFYWGWKKLRLSTLKNLRTIINFNWHTCDVNDVGKLTNLQKLIVLDKLGSSELEIFPQLAKFKLKHLRSSSFYLRNEDLWTTAELRKMSNYPHSRKLFLDGKIEKLPAYESLPQQLRKLVLAGSHLEEDPMPILEKLENLVFLMLADEAFKGKEMVCSAIGFPQLKHVLFGVLEDLEEWKAAEGAVPHLSRLGIACCPKLKVVPPHVSRYDGTDEIYEYMRKRPNWLRANSLWVVRRECSPDSLADVESENSDE